MNFYHKIKIAYETLKRAHLGISIIGVFLFKSQVFWKGLIIDCKIPSL